MRIIFFTPLGAVLFISSCVLTIFSKNLFLKFVASSLFFFFIFLFLYYLFLYLRYRKDKIELYSVVAAQFKPFEESFLEVECKNGFRIFPGFFTTANFVMSEKKVKIKTFKAVVLNQDKKKFYIRTNFERHGVFELNNFSIVVKDFLGLSEYVVGCTDFNYSINISPYFTEEIPIPALAEEGGDRIIQSVKKINSTDFFDNRKYYPGDDVRRMNWKVFAHINELCIRQEEKIPPKIGEIYLYFFPYSHIPLEYEYISSIFLSTVYFLIINSYLVKIFTPSGKIIKIDREKELYDVLNDSFVEFEGKENFNDAIVFASFHEFQKIVKNNNVKDSFFATTFYNMPEDKMKYPFFKIDKSDNILKEFYFIFRDKRKHRERLKKLQEISYLLNNCGSHINIFETYDNESKKLVFK
ncbi:MAG TPA: DUF58 domain-containing protein [Spirochaetota bacterium]|nr:DUF58 domain-containing protein [Spirochaetota bacterium]